MPESGSDVTVLAPGNVQQDHTHVKRYCQVGWHRRQFDKTHVEQRTVQAKCDATEARGMRLYDNAR